MDHWQALKTELHREAEAIFRSSGELVLIEYSNDFDLTLCRQSAMLKLSYVPERTAVRWETTKEYGFEAIRGPSSALAKTLIKELYRQP